MIECCLSHCILAAEGLTNMQWSAFARALACFVVKITLDVCKSGAAYWFSMEATMHMQRVHMRLMALLCIERHTLIYTTGCISGARLLQAAACVGTLADGWSTPALIHIRDHALVRMGHMKFGFSTALALAVRVTR